MMRIGIFGGTFNPIHYGHLLLAETARETLTLDRVVFIPTYQPPHKTTKSLLSGQTRLELIRCAIHNHSSFVASEIELERKGTSYTIETVKSLRTQLPQAKLFLLIGEDMLAVRWASWKELKQLCTVVAARRPGAKPRRESGIKWLEMPQTAMSSSDIRARLKAGKSIRYLVPSAVERYIRHHQLYQ